MPTTVFGRLLVDNPLALWQGKAFQPIDTDSGRGYNTFSAARLPDAYLHRELTSP